MREDCVRNVGMQDCHFDAHDDSLYTVRSVNDCSSVEPHRFTVTSDLVKDLDKMRASSQQNETQADRHVDTVIEQLDCWAKETQRLTIQLRQARDQFVAMVIKKYEKVGDRDFQTKTTASELYQVCSLI